MCNRQKALLAHVPKPVPILLKSHQPPPPAVSHAPPHPTATTCPKYPTACTCVWLLSRLVPAAAVAAAVTLVVQPLAVEWCVLRFACYWRFACYSASSPLLPLLLPLWRPLCCALPRITTRCATSFRLLLPL